MDSCLLSLGCIEQDVMKFVKEDVVVVSEAVLDPLKRRLVNEYTISTDGNRALSRHDVELIQYLHQLGLRVVPVPDISAFKPEHVMAQQSTNHVCHP